MFWGSFKALMYISIYLLKLNVFRQEMRTGKIKIIAFQGETDFAGRKSTAGREAKKDKKSKKQGAGSD